MNDTGTASWGTGETSVYVNSVAVTDVGVYSLLNAAINRKDIKATKKLLKRGADPNYQGEIDNEISPLPLCQAASAESENVEILKVLVEHGADVLQQDKLDGCIALHKAAYSNKDNALYLLTCCTPEKVLRQLYTRNKSGEKILDCAIPTPDANYLTVLNKVAIQDVLNKSGDPMIAYYVYNNDSTMSKQNLVKENVCERKKKLEHLFLVSQFGELQEVQKYLEDEEPQLSDVNRRNHIGDTALHCASRAGRLDVVSFLLERKADLMMANDQRCIPLHLAVRWNRADVVRILTSGVGPEIVARQLAARDTDDRTPAELSRRFGHCELDEYLNIESRGDGIGQMLCVQGNLPYSQSDEEWFFSKIIDKIETDVVAGNNVDVPCSRLPDKKSMKPSETDVVAVNNVDVFGTTVGKQSMKPFAMSVGAGNNVDVPWARAMIPSAP